MGLFKSLFRTSVPELHSYSDIYDLAFEYVSTNRSKQDLRKILKQATILNNPITKEDVFKVCSVACWLGGLREFDDVRMICSRILTIDPNNYQAIALLLNIALSEKSDEQIISFCSQLLESDYQQHVRELQLTLDSNIPEIRDSIKHVADMFHNAGGIFMGIKNFEKAKRCYEIAFEIDPTFFEAHNNIGITLYKLQRYRDAIISFKKDVEILERKHKAYPYHPELEKVKNRFLSRIHFNTAKSFFRINQMLEADEYLRKSISLAEEYKNQDIEEIIDDLKSELENDVEL